MSLLWSLLERGYSMPSRATLGGRLTMWCGRQLVKRHRSVTVSKGCLIHPGARIHPRNGVIRFGERTYVADAAVIQGNVCLGDDCSIQTGSILIGYGDREDHEGSIRIGHGVRIAPMVLMVAADHVYADPDQPIRRQGLRRASIIIEDDAWLAGRVSVTAGVTIGRGSVVAGGAVVTRDVPAFSVVAGVPARVIKHRRAHSS